MRRATVTAAATNSAVRLMQWRCPYCGERNAWDQCGDGLYPVCLMCGRQVKLKIGERVPTKIHRRPNYDFQPARKTQDEAEDQE